MFTALWIKMTFSNYMKIKQTSQDLCLLWSLRSNMLVPWHFCLPSKSKLVYINYSSGITPLISMVEEYPWSLSIFLQSPLWGYSKWFLFSLWPKINLMPMLNKISFYLFVPSTNSISLKLGLLRMRMLYMLWAPGDRSTADYQLVRRNVSSWPSTPVPTCCILLFKDVKNFFSW